MAATVGTMAGQYKGQSLLAAFTNPNHYDIIQIINQGRKVIANVTYNGVVNLNPTLSSGQGGNGLYTSNKVMVKRFEISPAYPQATLAQIFLAAFPQNPNKLDIIQIVNLGGTISFWVDYLGVAHGA